MGEHCTPLVCRSQKACQAGHVLSAITFLLWLALGGHILLQQPPITSLFLITVMSASFIVNTAVKYITQKERPEALDDFGARFHLGVQKKSFPSCHTQLSFTALTLIHHFQPALTPPATLLALLTAFIRYYLGRHWLIDILAGILLGVLTALAGILIWGYAGAD